MDDVKRQYEEIGEAYAENQEVFFDEEPDWARRFLRSNIEFAGKSVLDLGCGHGEDMVAYEEQGATAYGVDISDRMVNKAMEHVDEQGRVEQADIEDLPFSDDSFDVVVSRFGFHYQKTFDRAYEEAHRVLASGGVFALVLPHPVYDALYMDEPYGSDFLVEVSLYDEAVTVRYPSHTLEDYFSETFTSLFALDRYVEELQSEVDGDRHGVPSSLGLIARKP